MNKVIWTAAFLLATLFMSASHAEEWKLEKDKDGIKVYTRSMPDSKMKEYKGIATIQASPDEIIAILKDVKHWDRCMYKCAENSAKLLKVEGEIYYTYMQVDTPWPAADRDVVTVYKFNEPSSDGSVYIEFWGDADYIPEKNGFVRVPALKGYWKLIPDGKGKTQVIHQAYSDPGGKVPDWMANMAVVDAPFTTLEKIRIILSE